MGWLFFWLTDYNPLDISLTVTTGLAISFIAILYRYQTRLIYLPQFPPGARTHIWKPSEFGFHPKHDEEVFIKTSDGVTLHGYWLSDEANDGKHDLPTFIYFQGNAGNIGHRLPILQHLHSVIPCNTFIISYRGFGRSEGTPSEVGMRIDAQAALDYVLARPDACSTRIILYGQSIGGAVALDLAARNQRKIFAIVLENTFLSLRKLIPHVLPWLGWLGRICHQKWDSEERLKEMVDAAAQGDVHMPHMLFLSGSKDILVPPWQMKKLHDIACQDNKATIVLAKCPTGDHVNTVQQPEYFQAIQSFTNSILKS